MSYNGWENYETWVVNLWIGNSYSSYHWWKTEVEERLEVEDYDTDAVVQEIAEQLKEDIESQMPEVYGMYKDLLLGAMSEVNYGEIATAWVKETVEELQAESKHI